MIKRSTQWRATNEQVVERIAENASRLADAQGLSGRELARRTGDSHSEIARMLSGNNMVGVAVVVRVADALGVGVEDLLSSPIQLSRKIG